MGAAQDGRLDLTAEASELPAGDSDGLSGLRNESKDSLNTISTTAASSPAASSTASGVQEEGAADAAEADPAKRKPPPLEVSIGSPSKSSIAQGDETVESAEQPTTPVSPSSNDSDAISPLPVPADSKPRSNFRQRLGKFQELSIRSDVNKSRVFRLLQAPETIETYYDFGGDIYSGSIRHNADRVLTATRRSDGEELVVKVRGKRASGAGELRWREIMQQLAAMRRNRHVLDILEILEDNDSYYIVMPKCKGGELHEFLMVEAEVPESECQRITREILVAVGHLHLHNIVHRDIKPENIMFDKTDQLPSSGMQSPGSVKLLDYDTCVEWTTETPRRRCFAGTPGYIAPEALLGDATPQSDLFSVGVILFILMTGVLPWRDLTSLEDGIVGSPKANRMYKTIKEEVKELDWEMEPWPCFPLARDLCQQLLAFDPEHRMSSVEAALNHPWLVGLQAE